MTNVPPPARPEALAPSVAADVTAIEPAARGPLLFLLGSGLVWLLVSGLLALITSIQLTTPRFLADYSFLTYGRLDAMRETAFVYGWAANAGLAITLWVMARLGRTQLRALHWAFTGAAFWNLGLTIGLIGLATGDLTSFSLFQLPRYVQPLMVFCYAALAISGVLAWSGRRNDEAFAAQWYGLAALVLYPWLSSAAQVVLQWEPPRGVVQNIAASWYAQGAWALWLAPLALGAAYYVVPRLSGRTLPGYEFAPLGFWVLIFAGAWTGGRHLVGGPVPAWVVTIAVVAAVVLLIHYAIVAMNLRPVFGVRGTAAGFIRFGLVAYVLAGILDAVTAFRSVALETHFTFVTVAVQQLALYGGVSMIFFGAVYFLVPRLTGTPWSSALLTAGHRWLVMLGVVVLVGALAVAGWMQGADLLRPDIGFAAILARLKLPLHLVTAAQLVLLAANLLLWLNFLRTITSSVISDVVALNPMREATEVSAS